jgi:hypothetical protein
MIQASKNGRLIIEMGSKAVYTLKALIINLLAVKGFNMIKGRIKGTCLGLNNYS